MDLRYINPLIGSGVFASHFIPKGTIVFFPDPLDQIISSARFAAMPRIWQQLVDKYGYVNRDGNWIVGWDNSIYINHSCNPNALDTPFGFEIAIQDIQPGEQMTIDYGLLNLTEDMPVSCGCLNCRKVLHPDDMQKYASLWDAQIKAALLVVPQVPQPLWAYMDTAVCEQVVAVLDGKLAFPSVRSMVYTPRLP
jgi:hypothetical protein